MYSTNCLLKKRSTRRSEKETSRSTPQDSTRRHEKNPRGRQTGLYLYGRPAPAPAAAAATATRWSASSSACPASLPTCLHHLRRLPPHCYPRLSPHTPRQRRHGHDGSVNHLLGALGKACRSCAAARSSGRTAHRVSGVRPTGPAGVLWRCALPQQPETWDLRIPDGPQVRASVG